ncbi:MAG: hypothetical protein ACRBBN_20570 [Methyloligellaceae bacterium]
MHIVCSECNQKIQDKTVPCPHCGTTFQKTKLPIDKAVFLKNKNYWIVTAVILFIAMVSNPTRQNFEKKIDLVFANGLKNEDSFSRSLFKAACETVDDQCVQQLSAQKKTEYNGYLFMAIGHVNLDKHKRVCAGAFGVWLRCWDIKKR